MVRIWTTIALVALLLPFPAGPAPQAGDEPKASVAADGSRSIFICLDDAAPCIADTADGCAGCPGGPMQKDYALEPHMDALGKITDALKTAVRKQDFPVLLRLADMAALIAGRISEFQPPKNKEKLDGYLKMAAELSAETVQMQDAAKKEDGAAAKAAFRKLGATCSGCHQEYRPD